MAADAELMLLFAGLHVIGLALVALLLVMFLRSETVTPWTPPEDNDGGGGGGGNDRLTPKPPSGPQGGGLPLPDAQPARVRLRDHRRLADRLPERQRRAPREPVPVRIQEPR
jgi:hypothetical protein